MLQTKSTRDLGCARRCFRGGQEGHGRHGGGLTQAPRGVLNNKAENPVSDEKISNDTRASAPAPQVSRVLSTGPPAPLESTESNIVSSFDEDDAAQDEPRILGDSTRFPYPRIFHGQGIMYPSYPDVSRRCI
jgi:hypothetical protein